MSTFWMRHGWYSAKMHKHLAEPKPVYDEDLECFTGESRPGYVHIAPDGRVATILDTTRYHGCRWSDMEYVGQWPLLKWRTVPADEVPVRGSAESASTGER